MGSRIDQPGVVKILELRIHAHHFRIEVAGKKSRLWLQASPDRKCGGGKSQWVENAGLLENRNTVLIEMAQSAGECLNGADFRERAANHLDQGLATRALLQKARLFHEGRHSPEFRKPVKRRQPVKMGYVWGPHPLKHHSLAPEVSARVVLVWARAMDSDDQLPVGAHERLPCRMPQKPPIREPTALFQNGRRILKGSAETVRRHCGAAEQVVDGLVGQIHAFVHRHYQAIRRVVLGRESFSDALVALHGNELVAIDMAQPVGPGTSVGVVRIERLSALNGNPAMALPVVGIACDHMDALERFQRLPVARVGIVEIDVHLRRAEVQVVQRKGV